MRTAPLALFYDDDCQALLDKTVACYRVTHTHPSAVAGALVSVCSIASCLNHVQFRRQAYLAELVDVARQCDTELAHSLQSLEEMLSWPDDAVLKRLLGHS